MKAPKVTVYIPVYNHAKFVEKAIQSVFDQTFPDWELLVINDGSVDGSEEILKKYESFQKITVVNQTNKGLTITCNIALRLAKGQYFMRLDGDDYLDENALLVMSNYLDANPQKGLVFPDYYLVDEQGEVLSIERRERIVEGMLLDNPAHGACTMFRKSILQEMGGYNEEIFCQDGYDIWLRFIEGYEAGNINLPLFYYRQHTNNLTKDRTRILETRQKIKKRFADLKRKKKKLMGIKRVAIIPARTHSDVVLRLALEKLNDKTLIDYSIEEALKAECFSRVVVVTEDEEILRYVRNSFKEVTPIPRPLELARRNSSIDKTVQFTLDILKNEYNEEYEEAILLFIEAPLKRGEHIAKAIDTMHIYDADSVIPITETYHPHYIRGKKGLERIGNSNQLTLERNIVYRGNGALLAFKTCNLSKFGNLAGERIGNVVMSDEESIFLITPFDYKIAGVLLKERERDKGKNEKTKTAY